MISCTVVDENIHSLCSFTLSLESFLHYSEIASQFVDAVFFRLLNLRPSVLLRDSASLKCSIFFMTNHVIVFQLFLLSATFPALL